MDKALSCVKCVTFGLVGRGSGVSSGIGGGQMEDHGRGGWLVSVWKPQRGRILGPAVSRSLRLLDGSLLLNTRLTSLSRALETDSRWLSWHMVRGPSRRRRVRFPPYESVFYPRYAD